MNIIDLQVEGMSCGSCVEHVTQALQPLPGVSGVEVDLSSGRVRVSGELAQVGVFLVTTLTAASYPAKLATAVSTSSATSPPKASGCHSGSSGGVRLLLTARASDLLSKESSMFYEKYSVMGRRWLLAASMASAGLLMAAAPWVALAQTSLDATATQSSNEQDVTVKVTAKSMGLVGSRCEFAVVLDTHGADLSDDLTQSATLKSDDGRTFKPTGWLSAPPGGHHREGVLAFDVHAPRPSAMELRIDRPGESAPRIFRWKL